MTTHETVPVDQRWLGIDKRGLPYAAVALALIVLLVWVVPAINDAVEWDDPTVAGDVIDLGSGITVTPPIGWQLQDGIRVGQEASRPVNADNSATLLANGGATIAVTGSSWDGSADELLDQYNRLRDASNETDDKLFKVTGERGSITTADGNTGVTESYTTANGEGRAFAFVVDNNDGGSTGIVISAATSADTIGQFTTQIDDLVASLTVTESPS